MIPALRHASISDATVSFANPRHASVTTMVRKPVAHQQANATQRNTMAARRRGNGVEQVRHSSSMGHST